MGAELAGTPEAKKLLHEWAASTSGTRLSDDAAAALERIGRKRSGEHSDYRSGVRHNDCCTKRVILGL